MAKFMFTPEQIVADLQRARLPWWRISQQGAAKGHFVAFSGEEDAAELDSMELEETISSLPPGRYRIEAKTSKDNSRSAWSRDFDIVEAPVYAPQPYLGQLPPREDNRLIKEMVDDLRAENAQLRQQITLLQQQLTLAQQENLRLQMQGQIDVLRAEHQHKKDPGVEMLKDLGPLVAGLLSPSNARPKVGIAGPYAQPAQVSEIEHLEQLVAAVYQKAPAEFVAVLERLAQKPIEEVKSNLQAALGFL